MNHKKNKTIILEILKCQTSEEIEKIIKKEKLDQEGWLFYGGRSNNVGTVDGQMRDADNALMEKITNSIDAILMPRCYEEGIDPRDKNTAQNMSRPLSDFLVEKTKFEKNDLNLRKNGCVLRLKVSETGQQLQSSTKVKDNSQTT